jgi:DNA-binding winged helix-turn-helix (wHTH) protein/tetratricopeptide (TPR) repeat protein
MGGGKGSFGGEEAMRASDGIFCFADFTLDLGRGSLRREDREVPLRLKCFALLRCLVENADRLVSKDELFQTVWPNVIATDEALTRCVSDLRQALQDDAQQIVKTVRGRGYIFAAAVTRLTRESKPVESSATPPSVIAPADAVRVEVLSRSEAPRDEPHEARFEHRSAERRSLTIMACKIVGLAALAARLDPEDLHAVTAACHRQCGAIIARHNGTVARCSGEDVVAYFGYPLADEYESEKAVQAALALIAAAPKLPTADGPPLQARIGIATGLVMIADSTDAGTSSEPAVVGEPPALAAQLCARAEPGTIVISSNTKRLTGGLFEYRDLAARANSAEGVPAWQVLGANAVESRFEALRATTTPLVGRGEEMDLLLRRWEQAKIGEGAVVLISGEPGIGKSRLVQTMMERLGGEPHVRLRYSCSPHHRDAPLYPVLAQLERAARFRRDDTNEQKLVKLEALLSLSSDDLSASVPVTANLLSLPVGERYPALDLVPHKHKEKILRTLLAQVEGLAARGPLLVLCEDIQWSDPTTRDVLDMLIDRAPALRVLVIITFRSEFVPPWVGSPQVSLVSLNRLPPRQRAEMIAQLIGSEGLPKEIADQITDRSDGVPLFIEELTKSVVENGRWLTPDRSPSLAIPISLQASLLARFNRLGPPAREVAQIAASLGRSFSYEMISAVASMPQAQLADALAEIVGAELIYRRGTPPDAEYTFKHALMQDAAYATLLLSRRRQLHGHIVATFEAHFPDIVAAQPGRLAQHCVAGGLSEKAAVYWLKAGHQALARSAMAEAEASLLKGLDVLTGLPDDPWRREQELGLQVALRAAQSATKGYSAAEVGETLARAYSLAEQIKRPDYLPPLLSGQLTFHWLRSEHRQALALAERIEQIGEAQNDFVWRLHGRRMHGTTRFLLGEFVAARLLLEQCLDPADATPDARVPADLHVSILSNLALALTYLGYLDQARLRLNQALSEARGLDHAEALAAVLLVANWIACTASFPELASRADELMALSTENGFQFYLGWAKTYRGWSLMGRGMVQECLMLLTEGRAALRSTGTVAGTPAQLTLLAETYASAGRPDEGLDCLEEAERLIEATEERYGAAELYRVRGDVLNGMGDVVAAEHNYHRAIEVARSQSTKLLELRAANALARLLGKRDTRKSAQDLLTPICGWFSEGFDAPDLKIAKAMLAQMAPGLDCALE